MGCLHHTPPPSLRDLCRRGGRRVVRARCSNDSKEIELPDQKDLCTYELIETMAALIGLAQVQARQDLRTERDKWMWGSIYNEEIYSKGKQPVYSNGMLWSLSTTLQGKTHAQEELAYTNKLHVLVWVLWAFCFSLFWLFFLPFHLLVCLMFVFVKFCENMEEDRIWSWVVREDLEKLEEEKNRLKFVYKNSFDKKN